MVVPAGVQGEFADELAGVAVQDADVAVVDQDDDVGAAPSFTESDVVQAAVVADGDNAAGVDAVVTYSVMRRNLVCGGKGFGPGSEGLQRCSSADGAVWAHGVVVGGEVVKLVLEFGDGGCGGLGAKVFFRVWWKRSILPQVCG